MVTSKFFPSRHMEPGQNPWNALLPTDYRLPMYIHGQSGANAWDQLRATRWKPPHPATATPERQRTYVTALQQAEELFRATAVTGPAAGPLPLFYGLSQAGRAVAAAAASIGKDAPSWKLNGHGIMTRSMDADLPAVQVITDPKGGSFVRLSELLGSPTWGKAAVPFSVLWDCLPETMDTPITDSPRARRTPLIVVPSNHPEPHPLATATVNFLPAWIGQADDPRKALDTYLADFPDVGSYDSYVRSGSLPDAPPVFGDNGGGWSYITVNWLVPGMDAPGPERARFLASLTRSYDGQLALLPAIAGSDRGIHPLMAWWAVLHALSMLARYQPAEWAEHTDVDSSRYAVPIERLLTAAHDVVPRLLVEAIAKVSA